VITIAWRSSWLLVAARKQTFKDTTIRYAFRDAEIIPPNRNLVLEKMEEYNRKKAKRTGDGTTLDSGPSTTASTPPVASQFGEKSWVLITTTKPKDLVKMKQAMGQLDTADYT
jgi:hypothetical protein